MAAAAPSAHVCTPALANPHNRPYKPRNYGRVVAGEAAPKKARPKRVSVDLSAFSNAMPPMASVDADNATFWASSARWDLATLQAAVTLQKQLRAGEFSLPQCLSMSLAQHERELAEKILQAMQKHGEAGGTEGAQLLQELNAITGRGAA